MIVIPHFDLQSHNTMAVPSIAEYFVRVSEFEDLDAVRAWLKGSSQHSWSVLGGGSNVILPAVVSGLVIQNAILGFDVIDEADDCVLVKIGAGEDWHEIVSKCVDYGFWGIENLALIPGTVGAAPIQNIGAYGVELKDCLVELEAYEMASGLMVKFDNVGCRFGYRDSIFKQSRAKQYVITSITLKLSLIPRPNLSYPPLAEQVQSESLQAIFDTVCSVRSEKLPDPNHIPNSGSFFKNPIVNTSKLGMLRDRFKVDSVPNFAVGDEGVKVPAAWLIDQAGWKGFSDEGVGVHDRQALVIVNPGRTSAECVLRLAHQIQADILRKTGIELEIEPQVLGGQ